MKIELGSHEIEIVLEALEERRWALAKEAEGKFEPRDGSPRALAAAQAAKIQLVEWAIEAQMEDDDESR